MEGLKESWSRFKDHKIRFRNSYACGNKEAAVAYLRAARFELQEMERKIIDADRPAG